MSQSTEQQLLKLVPLIRWLLVGAAAIAGWVTAIEFRTQSIQRHEERLNAQDVWRAEELGSRYTSQEAARQVALNNDALNSHDKRITRNEDTLTMIKDLLIKINDKISP